MKILHAVHGFLPQFRGGTELYVWNLAREQRALGHDVHIVTGTTHFASEPKLERYVHDQFPVWKIVLAGAYLEHWTRSTSPAASALFAEVLHRVRPDVVHVQHWYRLSRRLIAEASRAGIAAVCTLHDLWTTCPRIFRIRDESFCERPLGRESCTDCVPRFPWMDDALTGAAVDAFKSDFAVEMKLARRIIVPSMAHGRAIARFGELKEDRIYVVPHGTIADLHRRLDVYDRDGETRRDASRPIRIGSWGHLFHMKGVHLILEALQTLRAKSRFEVHVWGQVVEAEYKARLDALSRGVDVTWHGAFTPADVEKQALDLAIIPSLCSESYSFVLDEAFQLGLPAIVADRGALGERIGGAGTAFTPESAEDLARVFKKILRDRSLIDRWRAAIPPLIAIGDHARALIEVYQDAVEEAVAVPLGADVPDASAEARLLSQTVLRYEEVMFGYLGHIKRETGRGDHYEVEYRKAAATLETVVPRLNETTERLRIADETAAHAMQIVDFLGREIEAFRGAMNQVHAPEVHFERAAGAPPVVPEHVPGLGSTTDVASIDGAIIAGFIERLKVLMSGARSAELHTLVEEKERRITELDRMIGKLNADVAESRACVGGLENTIAELRGRLGAEKSAAAPPPIDDQLSALLAERNVLESRIGVLESELNSAADLKATIKDQKKRIEYLDRVIHVLSGMVDTFRKAVAKTREPEVSWKDTSFALAKDLREFDAPNLGKLADALRVNTAMMTRYIEDLKALQSRVASVGDLESRAADAERALATKVLLIEGLGGFVEELRRALTQVFDGAPVFESPPLPAEVPEEHVPGLGDLMTIQKTNVELLQRYLDQVESLRRRAGGVTPDTHPASE